jgi:hypothetical protein
MDFSPLGDVTEGAIGVTLDRWRTVSVDAGSCDGRFRLARKRYNVEAVRRAILHIAEKRILH